MTHRRGSYEGCLEAVARRDHRRSPFVDRVDDPGVVDPAPVHGRDGEVGVAKLALDNEIPRDS
jgi:hypothetical protein